MSSFGHNLVVLDVKDKGETIVPGVVVGSHGTLSWEEAELLEQTGDEQEHPVLGQNLKDKSSVHLSPEVSHTTNTDQNFKTLTSPTHALLPAPKFKSLKEQNQFSPKILFSYLKWTSTQKRDT